MLTFNDLEEIKTLLRIAAYDWSKDFEETGRSSVRGLSWAAKDMEAKVEEAQNELLSIEKQGTADES